MDIGGNIMRSGQNIEFLAIFYASGFLFILIGLILMHRGHIIWSYEVIAMGVVFLLLGIDASRKPNY